MGIVSAVARQSDPDSQNMYIQTDAPINPGSSGGPLVNVDGELIGLNTFILSSSGGSQGLGFAIPSAVISAVYPELRKYGRLHRGVLGLDVQGITPIIAAALDLPKTPGVLVSDVTPGGPADLAGVFVQDVVVAINDRPVPNVPPFGLALTDLGPGDSVTIALKRGSQAITLTVVATERPASIEQLIDLIDPRNNTIAELGIVVADVTSETPTLLLPNLRTPSGVAVAAKLEESRLHAAALVTGDVIHAVDGFTVRSIDGLRVLLGAHKQKTDAVLQIERNGRLMFVTCTPN
jgi:serine protease Do